MGYIGNILGQNQTINNNEIELPQLVTINIQYKIRVRRMMTKETQNFHIMIKQGKHGTT